MGVEDVEGGVDEGLGESYVAGEEGAGCGGVEGFEVGEGVLGRLLARSGCGSRGHGYTRPAIGSRDD